MDNFNFNKICFNKMFLSKNKIYMKKNYNDIKIHIKLF